MPKEEIKTVTTNKKAFHDYFITDKIEAGIELKGTEVKSIRAGQINLKDSYAKIINQQVFLLKCHISPYDFGGYDNHDPERDRRLLLHRNEIRRLQRNIENKGQTLIPLRVLINAKGKVKVEIGLAKGKRQYDKREAIADKDARREMQRLRKG
ncbi:MAG: SsrA-binding protein SmpB [Candidatus Marinimicrobia bacterium]|nr:SsrA-binding protein SmpB [Candidatus Neomarinimicrobiota bacterium]MCK9484003.1 SsrA-binding protein SmpB [Candidatus Neomarinimicrobiota bacterium]MCK9559786.1 SsrA-binding protein SmpB [Candidatus Neomarinimicrobiota bacterium]MDD5062258.1 SsrA-binding protein SmpB [Candidatus Neomarinimicrobiota bacterium]MDD5540715.1 SsrA-binding protein SmpB [Candidatus Neomarinimicrobiota bacterium]